MRRRAGSADLTALANHSSASGVSSWDTINLSGSPVHADTPETDDPRAAYEAEAGAALIKALTPSRQAVLTKMAIIYETPAEKAQRSARIEEEARAKRLGKTCRSPSLFTSEEIIRLNKSIDEAAKKDLYAKLETTKKSDVVSSKLTKEQQIALFADKIIFDGTYFTLKNIRPPRGTTCHPTACIGFYNHDTMTKFQLLANTLDEINETYMGEDGHTIFPLEADTGELILQMTRAALIQLSDDDFTFTANPTDFNNLYEILYEEARKTYNEGVTIYKGNPSKLTKLEKVYGNFLTFLKEQHQAALDYLKLFHRLAEKPKAEAKTRDVPRYAFRC